MSHGECAFRQMHSKSCERLSTLETNIMNSSNYTSTAFSSVMAAVKPAIRRVPFGPNHLDGSSMTRTDCENSEENVTSPSDIKFKEQDQNRIEMREEWHYSRDLPTAKCQSRPRVFSPNVSTNSIDGLQNSDSLCSFGSSHQSNQEVSGVSLLRHARSSNRLNVSEGEQASSDISESLKTFRSNQISNLSLLNHHKNFNSDIAGLLQGSSCCESIIQRRSKEKPNQLMNRNDTSPPCENVKGEYVSEISNRISAKLAIGTDGRHRVYALSNNPVSSCWKREAILHINESIMIVKSDIQFKDNYRRFYMHITSKGAEKRLYKKWCLVCDQISRINATQSQQSINDIFVTKDFQCLWAAILSIEILSLLGHNNECLQVCETEILGLTSFPSKNN